VEVKKKLEASVKDGYTIYAKRVESQNNHFLYQ
jgi:hypothetical protein